MEKDIDEKKMILKNEFDIVMTKTMEKGIADGRTEDATLAVRDERVRRKFYQEYGIAGPMR